MQKAETLKAIKGKSENDLIKRLSEPKPKINLSKKKIKKIKKVFSELRYRFSKSKINEFRRSLHNIKKQKNLFAPEIKETEKNLLELEKSLSNLKKYYDYDDTVYRGIRDIENSFNGNLLNRVTLNKIDKDYYEPIKTKNAFNNSYIEYESKGKENKNLSPKEYLNIIRLYLSDMINDHKTQSKRKI